MGQLHGPYRTGSEEERVYQSPRGTQDIVPEDAVVWRYVERQAVDTARRFGYGEIRTPTFEDASLFLRGIGAGTDVVDKEIYRFQDKGGSDLALRPEGTASVVRAYLSTGWPAARSRSSSTR